MFADIKAVMWKEYLEIFWAKSDRAKALFKLLLFMTVVTVFFPILIEDENRSAAWSQLWCLVPALITMSVIPDTVAGERERHTLETLLASRLNVRAIAFGKMAVAVIYAWSLTVLLSLCLLIKININIIN